MNTYRILIVLLFSLAVSAEAVTKKTSFSWFKTEVEHAAHELVTKALVNVPYEDQLLFLNLFLDPTINGIESSIKCFQAVEESSHLIVASEMFDNFLQKIVEEYYAIMIERFEKKKPHATDEEKQNFFGTLEIKVSELINYASTIYYSIIYKHLAQQNAHNLMFISDKNGIISAVNRTKELPKPVIYQ